MNGVKLQISIFQKKTLKVYFPFNELPIFLFNSPNCLMHTHKYDLANRRRSNCVKEVERLKKNREERR